jgi:hypothetical protein
MKTTKELVDKAYEVCAGLDKEDYTVSEIIAISAFMTSFCNTELCKKCFQKGNENE